MPEPDVTAPLTRGARPHPTAAPTHGPGGSRRVRHTIASTVTAAVLALLATLFGPLATAQAQTYPCPGGPSSGASSSGSNCPTLHNRDIVAEAAMPATLYRGDSRPPRSPTTTRASSTPASGPGAPTPTSCPTSRVTAP